MKKRNQINQKFEFWSHWKMLAIDKLQLKPIEDKISCNVRNKWLLKISFAAFRRYATIRQGKKQMY